MSASRSISQLCDQIFFEFKICHVRAPTCSPTHSSIALIDVLADVLSADALIDVLADVDALIDVLSDALVDVLSVGPQKFQT